MRDRHGGRRGGGGKAVIVVAVLVVRIGVERNIERVVVLVSLFLAPLDNIARGSAHETEKASGQRVLFVKTRAFVVSLFQLFGFQRFQISTHRERDLVVNVCIQVNTEYTQAQYMILHYR